MSHFDRTYDSSPSESSDTLPSPTDEQQPQQTMEPSTLLTKNISLIDIIKYHKCSIHHQDAEASIADATDCLRMITGKMEWFQRKHKFCPHLFSDEDQQQIQSLHQRLIIEEIPFLELQERFRNGLDVDIPHELQGRIALVCQKFDELKQHFDKLLSNVDHLSSIPIIETTNSSTTPSSMINTGSIIEV